MGTENNEYEVRISPITGKPIKPRKPQEKKKPHGLCGKPSNGKNSPVIGMNGYDLEPGDNTKYLQKNLHLMNLPDIDLHNPDAVSERINYYFEFMAKSDCKPTVAGLAMALNGMNRRTLIAIVNDYATGGAGYKTALPKSTALLIKRAYKIMETLWEDYMQNGKLNPVTGIFLGKNNYGYQDKTEHVITPNRSQEEYSVQDIRERYLIDSSET